MFASQLLPRTRNRIALACSAMMFSLILPFQLSAQACLGTPSGGGVAYDYLRYGFGSNGHGATAAVRAGRIALGANFNTRTINPTSSGTGGGGRIAGIINIWKLQLCPGIRGG